MAPKKKLSPLHQRFTKATIQHFGLKESDVRQGNKKIHVNHLDQNKRHL
jgi:hypothetical protein